MPNLPVIDFRAADADRRFVSSMHEIGFAILRRHPFDGRVWATIASEWLAFFDADAEVKRAHLHAAGSQSGYFPPPAPGERVAGGQLRDRKEFYQLQVGDQPPPGVSAVTGGYLTDALRLAARLLEWLDGATPDAGRPQGYSLQSYPRMITGSTGSTLRIQRYLPLRGDEPAGTLRALEHQDLNLVTLLPAPTSSGLQVKTTAGEWLDVPCGEGLLVVNAGRMLEHASGGYFPATPHRVAPSEPRDARRSRLSFPLFVHPRPDVDLGGLSAQAFLAQEVAELQRRGWAVAPGGVSAKA